MQRNPVYGFIAFLIVEGLVSFGFLTRDIAAEAQARIEELVFYVGLALTAAFGFHKYIDAHKHQVTKEVETYQEEPVKEKTIQEQINEDEFSQKVFSHGGSGTPPGK